MVHLQTLGSAAIRIGSTRLGPSSARAFSALLFLAAERGRRVSRNTLHALLFPDSADANGLHSVRQLLYKLRQVGAPLEGDTDTVVLPEASVRDDYSPLLAGSDITAEDLDRLASGFLPGYAPDFSEAYAEWLDQYRSSVTLRIRRQLVAELGRLREVGKWDRAARVARACLALDPLNEEATLALAEMLALSGSKSEAVRLLDHYLAEVGGGPHEMRIPAVLLRRRIAERFPEPSYRGVQQAPFIGRDEEMAELGRHLTLTRHGRLQTVLVSGDPGVGKSRLAIEFAKVAVVQGAVVRTVTAQPHDKRRPMSIFMDLTPELRTLPGALGCAPESLQLLTSLVAVDEPPVERSGSNPPTVFANATRAISDLLDAISAEVTLVVVIEDAQWVDQLSLITLADLTAERQDRRVLFLLTSREPRLLADAPAEIKGAHLPVAPLDDVHATELLREFLRGTPGEHDAELQAWCVRTGGGNPFFLHALATHHAATGERFSVPASLTELLARRLDRLDHRTATVFDACVLLGKHSTIPRLHQVLGVPALELAESLRVLEAGGFVLAEGLHLRSAHYLLSEVAAKRMPESVATLLHAQVARVLESTEADEQDASVLWDAAEHWYQAGEREHAVEMLEARAERAMAISQPQQAVELYERAMELAADGDTASRLARRVLVSGSMAGDYRRTMQGLSKLQSTGVATSFGHSHDDFELIEFDCRRNLGYERAGIRDQLLECLRSPASSEHHRLAAARRLLTYALEQFDIDYCHVANDVARKVPVNEATSAEHAMFRLIYETTFGDQAGAALIARRMLADSRNAPGARARSSQTAVNATFALYRLGHVEETIEELRYTYDDAVATSVPFAAHWSAAALTNICLDRGDLVQAHSWIESAEGAECRSHFRHLLAGHPSNCIRLAIFENRLQEAEIVLDRTAHNHPALISGRFYVVSQAYRIRIRQLRGRAPDSGEDLERLLSMHKAASVIGFNDDVTGILWYALRERDGQEVADAFLDQYLTQLRPDKYPPAYEIRQILEFRNRRGRNTKAGEP